MTIFPFLIITTLIVIAFFIQKNSYAQTVKQLETLRSQSVEKIIHEKKSVKSRTFTIGRKNNSYHFRKCDLIFLEKSLAIVPFYNIGKYKIYSNFFLITGDTIVGIAKLNRFDLNASGDDVRIEFGQAGFTTVNVEIRLKNLTQDEKKLIKIPEIPSRKYS